ncbi:TPA: hypothetical protein HA251_05640 [Candidatus Woesearchaeota archaeon]|nr:hypothetical protein [Candidatus Woesearchaeota archaeon]
MEESVWIYFGIILVIVALGITINVYRTSQEDGLESALFQGIENMGGQATIVCASPRDTMLSLRVDFPAGSVVRVTDDKICGTLDTSIRCIPAPCAMLPQTVLNLTAAREDRLFVVRQYTCAFLKGDTVSVYCQG